MMKKVLYIDLEKNEYKMKTDLELEKYIGGVSMGLKLLADNLEKEPLIFSIGPLNGYFPYASKTSIVFHNAGVIEDIYYGGTLSSRIKFTGIDSLFIFGKAPKPVVIDIHDEEVTFREGDTTKIDTLGLPGKRSIIKPIKSKLFLDDYYLTPQDLLEEQFERKNISGLVVTGTKTFELKNKEKYEELYLKILARTDELTVEKGTNPSCFGCPMGCSKSRIGEIGGNILAHSLVTCTYAQNIFSNIGAVFSCLNVLGYDYKHEDLEALPNLVEKLL